MSINYLLAYLMVTVQNYFFTAVEVVCRRPHRLDEQDLDVKIYYECLGQVEPFKLPALLVISDSDPKKLHFLIKSQSKQQALETQLNAVYGKPIWSKETITSSFTVKCTLTPETKDCRKLARTWETNVKESISIFFNQLNAGNHAPFYMYKEKICFASK